MTKVFMVLCKSARDKKIINKVGKSLAMQITLPQNSFDGKVEKRSRDFKRRKGPSISYESGKTKESISNPVANPRTCCGARNWLFLINFSPLAV